MKLKNFVDLSPKEQQLVFKWRNHEKIAVFMKNKNLSWEAYQDFLKSLKTDTSKLYFLVFKEEKPIGVIDFVGINQHSSEFGLYQSPYLKGFGNILMQTLLSYAKENLKLNTLLGCAYVTNKKALDLYQKFGFIFKEKGGMCYFSKDIRGEF